MEEEVVLFAAFYVPSCGVGPKELFGFGLEDGAAAANDDLELDFPALMRAAKLG